MARTASSETPVRQAPAVSLKTNFTWTFAGNAIFAASQWAVLSLIAKLGGAEMLGQYALALAMTAPVAMLSHSNLRAVLATDIKHRHPFGDYLAVRLRMTAGGLIAIAIIAFASRSSWPVTAAMVVIGISFGAEQISDIHYGLLQRRERMDQIARSMMARGILSLIAMGAVLSAARNLVSAVVALALGRIVVLLAYDRPKASAGERLDRSGFRSEIAIFRAALPLGVVLMLVSLTANLPRYAIEYYLGTRQLGAFAAVASFLAVGSTVVNALGQTATPRLARYFSRCDLDRFRRLTLELTGLALLLGAAGVLAAAVFGRLALRIVFRPDYSAYGGLLVAVMGAAVLVYVAITLGYVITSARSFAVQMPLLCAVAASSGIASWALVPAAGLGGAALAIAVAASVQIGGQVLILRRALRRLRSAT